MNATDPRYPIGKFEPKDDYASEEVKQGIDRISALPARLEKAIKGLLPAQLEDRKSVV